jgi:hypothetical protein
MNRFRFTMTPWGAWHVVDVWVYDGAPDAAPQCIGEGKTKGEALQDLIDQLVEREVYGPAAVF